jgi:hypothetical protein
MKEYIGKRVLLRHPPSRSLFEVRVLEVSPSGVFVKLESLVSGNTAWHAVVECEVLEGLKGPEEPADLVVKCGRCGRRWTPERCPTCEDTLRREDGY